MRWKIGKLWVFCWLHITLFIPKLCKWNILIVKVSKLKPSRPYYKLYLLKINMHAFLYPGLMIYMTILLKQLTLIALLIFFLFPDTWPRILQDYCPCCVQVQEPCLLNERPELLAEWQHPKTWTRNLQAWKGLYILFWSFLLPYSHFKSYNTGWGQSSSYKLLT